MRRRDEEMGEVRARDFADSTLVRVLELLSGSHPTRGAKMLQLGAALGVGNGCIDVLGKIIRKRTSTIRVNETNRCQNRMTEANDCPSQAQCVSLGRAR